VGASVRLMPPTRGRGGPIDRRGAALRRPGWAPPSDSCTQPVFGKTRRLVRDRRCRQVDAPNRCQGRPHPASGKVEPVRWMPPARAREAPTSPRGGPSPCSGWAIPSVACPSWWSKSPDLASGMVAHASGKVGPVRWMPPTGARGDPKNRSATSLQSPGSPLPPD
jgi:hypothetical protein